MALLGGSINKETKFPENDHRNYNIKGAAFDVGDTFSGVNFHKGSRGSGGNKKNCSQKIFHYLT